MKERLFHVTDMVINWSRQYSLWPMFFGLSCCFVEEAAVFTSRYDLARFGAEVLRPSPRQADLLITSGTIFKKVAPVVLRLYEQMAEPKWVISMGSCSNCGGMYDGYSVVQGIDQILPVDVYIPGCPPRPEAVELGLVMLQRKIMQEERPTRAVLGLAGGRQGSQAPILEDGRTKSRDPRGPGMQGTAIRGTSVSPPYFRESRSDLMWTPPPRALALSEADQTLARILTARFGDDLQAVSPVSDMPTYTVRPQRLKAVLRYLKNEADRRYARLDDLTVIDESARRDKDRYPDYTDGLQPALLRSARPAAPQGAPAGQRPGHRHGHRHLALGRLVRTGGLRHVRGALRRPSQPAPPAHAPRLGRAPPAQESTPDAPPRCRPTPWPTRGSASRWTAPNSSAAPAATHQLILNVGPHHVSTHGLMRYVVALDGEEITELAMDIGYHHRSVEKIGERQTWHQFIPYTDRVDYLAGAANNLPYVMAVETLADIRVPERAQCIRVLLSELFRLSNHLVWFATYAHDLGAMTPNFYTFREREMILDIVELITGGRLHPSWFRLGGVAADLPDGWKPAVDRLIRVFPTGPGRIREP